MKPLRSEPVWHEANQRYLMGAVDEVRRTLEAMARPEGDEEPAAAPFELDADATFDGLGRPPALEHLCARFGLSGFERHILLLCAGVELSSPFARVVSAAQGGNRKALPSFGLALSTHPEPHWSALTPVAPLRRWRLIDVVAGDTLSTSPLRIDERVLHFLAGVSYLDERLAAMLEPVATPSDLPASQSAQVDAIVSAWSPGTAGAWPLIGLGGDDPQARRAVAAAACARLGLGLYRLPAQAIPQQAAELDAFSRLWQREAALDDLALLVESGDAESAEPAREAALARVLGDIQGALFFSSGARGSALRGSAAIRGPLAFRRPQVLLVVAKPTAEEQRALWRTGLGDSAAAQLNGQLDVLSAQFDLDAAAIESACTRALRSPTTAPGDLATALWESCRAQARPQMNDMAQAIAPAAGWDDLVLPGDAKKVLAEIAIHVRQRTTVYDHWGFAAKGSRGLGISALFHGQSGTGKTMAAEVLANELKLDLYRIDLSRVVSKYIGETEVRLRQVFDAAEGGGAILLFDEADALFGKRSEVKDSHDRYANIEVSYLLQRMEAYRGLAILTTNMRKALDPAFLRRIRFVVEFAYPDALQRAEIWRRVFPGGAPLDRLDYPQLAQLQLAGGNIRNIAMNAAFLAADAGQAVGMKQVLQAARGEYTKLERPFDLAGIGGRA